MRERLRRRETRGSDLSGYIERLRELGFMLGQRWTKPYQYPSNSHQYIRTYWTLNRDVDRVQFRLSPHGYTLIIRRRRKIRLRVHARCWSRLEVPFLNYFKQEQPLCLRRMSVTTQLKIIRQWLRENPDQQRVILPRPIAGRPSRRASQAN